MTYSILHDCGCGFAIHGGRNNFCPKHNKIVNSIHPNKSYDVIMYRAGIGYIWNFYQVNENTIGITTKSFQEGFY